MPQFGHTSSVIVNRGFHLLVANQSETYACLLANKYVDDMGCCSWICFCWGCFCRLEDVIRSQLLNKLNSLPSGRLTQMSVGPT